MRAGWNRAAVGCEIFSMARRHRHAWQRPALNRGFATATLPRPRTDKSLDFYIRTSFKSRSLQALWPAGLMAAPAGATPRPLPGVVLPKRGGRGLRPQKEVREREKRSGENGNREERVEKTDAKTHTEKRV